MLEINETKQCPDCHGIGDFNDSKCCGGNIASDGTCSVCGFKTMRDPCLRCKGTGEVEKTSDDYEKEEFEYMCSEADLKFVDDQIEKDE